MSTLSFFGAAGTVTGSCSMLQANGIRALVDCGLFQGNKATIALNHEPFPFDAKEVDFLLLTHAHTDHSGLLPKLVKAGFAGPVYCTEPTADLLEFMMRDSAKIQEWNAQRRNKKNQRRGRKEIQPLFTLKDAEETLKRLKTVSMDKWLEPGEGFHVRFQNAGHILGSASIEIRYEELETKHTMRLLFSGDLGPDEKSFYSEPGGDAGFDYVVCESTYGDRDRDAYTLKERQEVLQQELSTGLARGGNIVIPSFAVERSQELLHDISVLMNNGQLPGATVFLDSPLASKVTRVFADYAHTLDDLNVPPGELFSNPNFRIIEDVEQSKAINDVDGGAIIISASGMADAGRIQHHLKNNIWKHEATVLFVGYQAPGTTGAHILSGASDVRIHGNEFKIRASIRRIGNYSAHADQGELLDWIMERGPVAGGLFLNHGDDGARAELKRLLIERGMMEESIWLPHFDESFDLTAGNPQSKGRAKDAASSMRARFDEVELSRDWYTEYASFSIALSNALEGAASDAERQAMLKQLKEVLD
ncbi:MAG: MBL fold metallo-hydrolase [Granulosicoccus sp.]